MSLKLNLNLHKLPLYNLYLTRVAATLAIFCTVSVFLYGIFLLMAVTHTASRSAAERQITSISAHLGDIEAQYLSEQQTLTPKRAQELGFVKPLAVSTVYATANTHTLTLNTIR